MRVRSSRHSLSGRRRAAVIPWLVVAAPVILGVLVLAWVVISQRHRQEELQVSADAAALAGANFLADELLLTECPDRFHRVRLRARKAALRFAEWNRADCEVVDLDPNLCNDSCGELVLGRIPDPFGHDFDCDCEEPNAVRVRLKRCGVCVAATAHVDRDVIGFRPQGRQPLPVVPLALLSDPFGPPHSCDRQSWDVQIGARQGTFEWRRDPETGRPQRVCREKGEKDDGIPEIKVCFGPEAVHPNGRMVRLGGMGDDDTCRGIETGLTRDDLTSLGGELMLNDPRKTPQPLALPRADLTGEQLGRLATALEQLAETGERRVWMLYSPRFDHSKEGRSTLGVIGFVAAQVMHVERQKDRLCVILQPGMIITAAAVTDFRRRELGPRPIHNPHICRVELVE